jgi:hypothetical protein
LRLGLLINHIKSNLTKKKTSPVWFNSEVLNQEIVDIFKKANEFEVRRDEFEKHIYSFELIVDSASKVQKISHDLKLTVKSEIPDLAALNESQRRVFLLLGKELIKFDGLLEVLISADPMIHRIALQFVQERRLIYDSIIERA